MFFVDKLSIKGRKVISIRDGVMEYLGSEIGKEPLSKVFKVYRSPCEVKRVSKLLKGIPITDGHIDPIGDIEDENKHGVLKTSKVISMFDEEIDSTIAVEHFINLSDNMLQYVQDNTPESSLGYTGKLVSHTDYDFEQVEIVPHHLAVIPAGRCGKICKFKDKSMDKFLNEDGTLNLKAFVEAVSEVMEKASDTEKMEISNSFKDMFSSEKKELTDMEKEEMKTEAVETVKKDDEFMDSIKKAAVKTFKDSKEFKTLKDKNPMKTFMDSTEFKDAVLSGAIARAEVITKSKPFLDEKYSFDGKTDVEIMSDTLKAEHKDIEFKDEEVAVAFKMLDAKKIDSHTNFGDGAISKWDTAKDKEV